MTHPLIIHPHMIHPHNHITTHTHDLLNFSYNLSRLPGVSIYAILQNPITSRESMDFVVTTESNVRLSQVQDFAHRIGNMPFALSTPLFMPILS